MLILAVLIASAGIFFLYRYLDHVVAEIEAEQAKMSQETK